MKRNLSSFNKILIIPSSIGRIKTTENLPAIERFTGVYFKVIRRWRREGHVKNVLVLILTDRFGLVEEQTPIPYYEPTFGQFGHLKLDPILKNSLREQSLGILQKILGAHKVDEIYINASKEFRELLFDIEKITSAKITYAQGRGIGPKSAHMRDWIIQNT